MPMEAIKLRRGDELHHIAAGGGGHGDPLRRDPALVREDVLDEKVSLAAARRDYGVVIDARTLAIDDAATAALRSSRREAAQ